MDDESARKKKDGGAQKTSSWKKENGYIQVYKWWY